MPSWRGALLAASFAFGAPGLVCAGPGEDGTVAIGNGRVACSERIVGGDQSQIFSFAADGSDRTELTTSGYNIMPTWSRDGEHILFTSARSGSVEIWVMNADGSDQRQLTSGLGPDYPDANVPAWSFDGSLIAFWAGFERRYGEIWVMEPDGSNPRRVTDTLDPRNSDDPHWSPDGSTIVYGEGLAGDRAMWLVATEGGEPSLFADGVHWCAWQPSVAVEDGLDGPPG